MLTYSGYIAFVFVIISAITYAEISLTTYYESDYRDRDTYYILNRESVTLVCEHGLTEDQVYDVIWYNSQGDTPVVLFTKAVVPGTEVQGTPLEDRDVTWTFTDTSHKLTIPQVNIFTDAIRYRCVVEDQGGNNGGAYLDLNNHIYDAPDSVSLSTIDFTVEDLTDDIQCAVSSIYPGREDTEFRVKVGSQYYTGGTESQSQDSNGVTYTVIYTQSLNFYRNHQGQEVQCEVIWGEGPIEVTKLSNTEKLDVYYVPSSVSKPYVSPSSQVTENTLLTLSCEVDSYPAGRLRLYRQGTTAPVKDVNANNLEYKVTVNRDDNGAQFYCRADDNNKHIGWEFDVESEKLRINVLYSPRSVTINGNSDPNPNLGDEREMVCTADANPEPVITLYRREGTDVVQVGNSAQNSLSETITMRREINRELFYCTATSSNKTLLIYSKDSDTKYYTVLFSASTITMTQSPSGPVSENKEVTFTCVTDEAEPTADVVWSVDGNTRSSDSDSTEEGMYNTQKRRSVLTVRVDRTLNNKKVECYISENTEATESIILDVIYTPEVSVQTASNTIEEDSQLLITCDVKAGNPKSLTSQFWEFDPKYPGTQTQALPGQRENRELRIESILYSDAGIYRCTAGNTVGSDTEEIQIVVHYPPQLTSNDPLTFYPGVGQQISLNITVRAFPEFSDPVSAFTWTTSSGSQITDGVTSTKLSDEIFYSEQLISSVKQEDYTSYIVTADNGVKEPVTFILDLIERGLPYPPEFLTFESVTSISVTLFWISGLNGGSLQTFTVYHRKQGESKIAYSDGIADTGFGTKIIFKATGLEPNTLYFFRVQSKNMHGESNLLPEVQIETLDLPNMKGALEATVYKAHIILQWQQISGVYSSAKLLSCMAEMICQTIHNFTGNGLLFFVLNSQYDGESYLMEVYQEEDNVLSKGFIIQDTRHSTSDNTAVTVVAVVLAVIVLVLTTMLIVGYIWYRRRLMENLLKKANDSLTVPQTYENVTGGTESSQYEMTKAEPTSLPSEYTELGHIHYDNIN